MPNKFLLTIAFLMLIDLKHYSQSTKKNHDKITIESYMIAQQVCWNIADLECFMNFYWKNDSLKFIGSKGITYGWQKTLDNYKKSYPNKEAMGELKFTIIENTQLAKDAIYIIGKWELKKDKPTGGHFTLLWRKINKEWVIVADHTS